MEAIIQWHMAEISKYEDDFRVGGEPEEYPPMLKWHMEQLEKLEDKEDEDEEYKEPTEEQLDRSIKREIINSKIWNEDGDKKELLAELLKIDEDELTENVNKLSKLQDQYEACEISRKEFDKKEDMLTERNKVLLERILRIKPHVIS